MRAGPGPGPGPRVRPAGPGPGPGPLDMGGNFFKNCVLEKDYMSYLKTITTLSVLGAKLYFVASVNSLIFHCT